MDTKEKRRLIKASFERTPCETCMEKFKHGLHPDHDMRCEDCHTSFQQRWKMQAKEGRSAAIH
jgi:PHP family Zn ribbon phosphoesterase